MPEPLYVAFVWHMHQPYYKSPGEGIYEMPWVRLHAIKDYLDMVTMLEGFPDIHQTFNLVPSLVEQLEEYAAGDARDIYWKHFEKPAEQLDPAERAFVVDLMCERSWHPRAQAHPRLLELAQKKEACLHKGIDACAATFATGELRDLQIWFNLSWFDPVYREREPLAELVRRGRDFSEEDKRMIARIQADILADTLPAYRRALERGAVELTTSPYFHPILPLLINSDAARTARGEIALPRRRFAHPEDAHEQIDLALQKHQETFGHRPEGMWCSEQAVGEDIILPLADRGITWTISDEQILARSTGEGVRRDDAGHVQNPCFLYRPYLLEREGRRLAIVFRDNLLSDLLGFTYQSWDPRDAAANFIWRLREIRNRVAGTGEPHLVTIALDGENAWEYYPRDGRDFLSELYGSLADDPGLRCVTVGEFLRDHPPTEPLPWLHTGSWINGDLSTWIGDTAHGVAWDQLHQARDTVARKGPNPEAWHRILVAEGSDWFWWYGDHQESGIDHLWDRMFRSHLQQAYKLVGEPPPADLFAPLSAPGPEEEQRVPQGRIAPVIDGRVSSPQEWSLAGIRRAAGGTMHRADKLELTEMRYGCDEHNAYFLLAPGENGFAPGTEIAVYFGAASGDSAGEETTDRIRYYGESRLSGQPGFDLFKELRLTISPDGTISGKVSGVEGGEWSEGKPIRQVRVDEVIEAAVALAWLGPAARRRMELTVAVASNGVLRELLPARGAIDFDPAGVADRRRASDQL